METSRAKHDAPPPVYLKKRRWRGAGSRLQPPAGPTPPVGPVIQGFQPSGLPYKGGGRPGAKGPEAGDPQTPETEAGALGAAGRARHSALPAAPGLRAEHGWPLGGARLHRAGALGLPTPPGLSSSPRSRPARRTDQARRLPPHRAQRQPDSGRGLSPASTAPPAPRPPLAAPGQRASPAASAALTSPARGAPSAAAAAAGARPVPAAPAAAPALTPRPRKRFPVPPPRRQRFRAGTDRERGAAEWASCRGSGSRVPPQARPGASPRTTGRAAALVPTPGGSDNGSALQASRPRSLRRPLLAGGGLRSGAHPRAPGAQWVRGQDPSPWVTRACAQPSSSESLAPIAGQAPAFHPSCAWLGS